MVEARLYRVMTEQIHKSTKRVRPSKSALTATLTALKEAGIPIGKVVLEGSKIEIHCGGVDPDRIAEEDDGLKSWYDDDEGVRRQPRRNPPVAGNVVLDWRAKKTLRQLFDRAEGWHEMATIKPQPLLTGDLLAKLGYVEFKGSEKRPHQQIFIRLTPAGRTAAANLT